MSIYDDMRGVASELFAEFKQGTVQYVPIVTTPGTSPDEPGSSGKGTPVTINATARPVSIKYVNGTTVVASDIQVAMPNDGTTPEMEGYMRIDGSDYKIIGIMPRPAAGTPVSWTVIVKR